MKIMSVVGARPQFVKLAPIAHEAAKQPDLIHLIVHTGQHYDAALSDVFFSELNIPGPNAHLNVGSGTHGQQTGAMLAALDPVIEGSRPDCVLVYGDTNSTLAAAVAAVKLHVPVAHLEAGLRSFNREMPEEHNRVLVDHAADLLLAPTETAAQHLSNEGLAGRTVVVGDIMTDVCFQVRDRVQQHAKQPGLLASLGTPYVVATLHRAENTDNPVRLKKIINSLQSLDVRVQLLVHPRLRARATKFNIRLSGGAVSTAPPLSYVDMMSAVLGSAGVVTDSGGLQKEAFLLGVPCTTLRSETEWVETLIDGWNVLDPTASLIVHSAARPKATTDRPSYYGDGRTAHRVVQAIRAAFACTDEYQARTTEGGNR